LEIDNVVVYPNPYNSKKGNLKIGLEVTNNVRLIKVRIYTVGYRFIKQIIKEGVYNAGYNEITIERRYIGDIANGVYYIIVECVESKGDKIKSKPIVFVVLR